MSQATASAKQRLTVGGTLLTADDGLTDLTLDFATDQFTVTSQGQRITETGGAAAATGSFTVLETEATAAELLGFNGAKKNMTWHDGIAARINAKPCIIVYSRGFAAGGQRTFNCQFYVDGPPT